MIEHMEVDGLLSIVPFKIISTEGSSIRIEQLSYKGVRADICKPLTLEVFKQVVDEVLEANHAG